MKHLIPLLFLLAGCGSSSSVITAADYGSAWPFTIDSGELACVKDGPRELVTLNRNGIDYALNGSAKSFGFPSSDAILKPGKTGADLYPFIQNGLEICRR